MTEVLDKNIEEYPTHEEILDQKFLDKYKNRKAPWGFGVLGEIVYYRTYSRVKEDGSRESWQDTIERCIRGSQKIGAKYTIEEAEKLYDLIFNLKCNFAGRMLWQLGTSTVDRFGLPSLCNCWGIKIDQAESFCFLFEHLMLGGGVGFSIRREHVHELPKVKELNKPIIHKAVKDADFIVPDSREGWIELLRNLLHSYFVSGKGFSFSTLLIRGHGEKIRGFGGTASGPQVLIDGIFKICEIFNNRSNKKLRSIDCLDICNILGSIVVAGNVRRSALLGLGDADDKLFLNAKRWDKGNIPNWRAMSNNTIAADDYEYLSDELWNGYEGNGEPYGLFNIDLCRKYGRLIDGPMSKSDIYPKNIDNVEVCNPCAEANLEHGEPCDLAEIYLNNVENEEELFECARLLYKTQKAVLTLPSISNWTEEVVKRNMRIGLGVTGICESIDKIKWLDSCYKRLRKFDKKWSKENGWQESIKISVIKPSGTLSTLAGCTPGAHPAYDRFFIRRIRLASSDPLVDICKKSGYKTEYQINFDGKEQRDTIVVEFPCRYSDNAILAKDMKAVDQLELLKKLQTYWADQSVSMTVYYRKDELNDIKIWLKNNYENNIKTVSFLLYNDHGFHQAPFESILEDKYNLMMKDVKPIDFSGYLNKEEYTIDNVECSGGFCPIK